MMPRWQAVRAQLSAQGVDAMLVTSLTNVRYLTGFTGSNGALLVEEKRAILYTDPRYEIQAQEEANCGVRVVKGALLDGVAKAGGMRRVKWLGFESEHITHRQWARLEAALPEQVMLKPLAGVVEGLRRIKSEEEIGLIAAAMKVTGEAFERAVKKIRVGMTEQELAAELDYQMRRRGAGGAAFETIVAFGEHAALPHARPGRRKLGERDLILVDMGAQREGYASDMTRMLHVGSPAGRVKQLYNAVREAQEAALKEIRPGVAAVEIDRAARRELRRQGWERRFVHSTGHGLGLEIHEGPRLGRGETAMLAAGMVITVEPGVYWEGWGGIRIEDTVVVTERGYDNLTPISKELRMV